MTLVQIDLRRGTRIRPGRAREPRNNPGATDAAEGDHASGTHAAAAAVEPTDHFARVTAGLVLAGGLVLLAPVAAAAAGSFAALVVVLAGLVALGLFAVLLLPAIIRVDPQ